MKIVIGILGVFGLLTAFAIHSEKKAFNNGICPDCKRKLVCFDTDSHGGRGYTCKNRSCGYYTWVSYKCVDKKFR